MSNFVIGYHVCVVRKSHNVIIRFCDGERDILSNECFFFFFFIFFFFMQKTAYEMIW